MSGFTESIHFVVHTHYYAERDILLTFLSYAVLIHLPTVFFAWQSHFQINKNAQ